jgi:hypothetical protein
MSEIRECHWCGKQAPCEEVDEQWICAACAVWDCSKCGSTVQVGDYHCGECDGCDSCCGCDHEEDEEVCDGEV